MAKLNVNKDVCIACGLCTQLAPSLFELDASGQAKPVNAEVSDDLRDSAEDTASNCPASAITVE